MRLLWASARVLCQPSRSDNIITMKTEYVVNLEWDSDAAVWVATSEDVPGLALESGSFDALVERLRSAVPELLALNGTDAADAVVCLRAERRECVFA